MSAHEKDCALDENHDPATSTTTMSYTMVAYEAARLMCYLVPDYFQNVSQLIPAIEALQILSKSQKKPAVRHGSQRLLAQIATKYPEVVAQK